jgi:hypothetical protein
MPAGVEASLRRARSDAPYLLCGFGLPNGSVAFTPLQ